MTLFTDLHDLTHYELRSKFLRKTYVIYDQHIQYSHKSHINCFSD